MRGETNSTYSKNHVSFIVVVPHGGFVVYLDLGSLLSRGQRRRKVESGSSRCRNAEGSFGRTLQFEPRRSLCRVWAKLHALPQNQEVPGVI